MTVLKDAASTSIYGSRGANGVVVVTTKKGRSGKPVIRLDAEYGTGQIAFQPEKGGALTRDELEMLTKEGLINAGASAARRAQILNALGYNSTANYNWLDLSTRNSTTKQLNLSTSGGDSNTQFYVSGGYFAQEGVFLGSEFTRYSGAFNINQKLGKKITINPNINIWFFQTRWENLKARTFATR